MAKASIVLQNGTRVSIEGTPDEIQQLLILYGGSEAKKSKPPSKEITRSIAASSTQHSAEASPAEESGDLLTTIVQHIRDSDEADSFATKILDRISLVNRILLPLYIIHEYLNNKMGLTSGDISKVTTELGIRVSQPNASTYLSSTAARYVVPDRRRKKGDPVRYKLSRKGLTYFKGVLEGTSSDD